MGRQTDTNHLRTRFWLIELWRDDLSRGWFSYLTAGEQWALHRYFQIDTHLTDHDALAHRQGITNDYPSLPQRAGKAAAHLDRLITYGPLEDPAYQRQQVRARQRALVEAAKTGKKPRVLTVRAEMQPEIDVDQVVRAILMTARDLQKREDDSAAAPPPAA